MGTLTNGNRRIFPTDILVEEPSLRLRLHKFIVNRAGDVVIAVLPCCLEGDVQFTLVELYGIDT